MIKFSPLLLVMSFATATISWSANNSNYFPLQVGNTWTYFWGYELPECCTPSSEADYQCLFECIIEGGTTGLIKNPVSADERFFDIRGNRIRFSSMHQRNVVAPAGIYVSQSGKKMVSLRNRK